MIRIVNVKKAVKVLRAMLEVGGGVLIEKDRLTSKNDEIAITASIDVDSDSRLPIFASTQSVLSHLKDGWFDPERADNGHYWNIKGVLDDAFSFQFDEEGLVPFVSEDANSVLSGIVIAGGMAFATDGVATARMDSSKPDFFLSGEIIKHFKRSGCVSVLAGSKAVSLNTKDYSVVSIKRSPIMPPSFLFGLPYEFLARIDGGDVRGVVTDEGEMEVETGDGWMSFNGKTVRSHPKKESSFKTFANALAKAATIGEDIEVSVCDKPGLPNYMKMSGNGIDVAIPIQKAEKPKPKKAKEIRWMISF